jgi:tetratricopeptide (TPR) repeat protein
LRLTDPDAPRQFVYRWQPIVQQFVQRQQPDLIEAHRFAIAHHDQHYLGLGKWQTKADIDNYIEDWYHKGELAKLTGDRQGEACSHSNQGQGYFYLGRPRESHLHLEQALSIVQEAQDKRGEAITLNRLGNSYSFIGNYQKAIESYKRSLKVIHNDLQIKGSSYGGLGLAFYYLKSYEKSLLYNLRHYKIACKVNDEYGQATALSNLGNTYTSLGRLQEALECHESSLTVERKRSNPRGEAASLNSLGFLYEILGDCNKAINYCEQSLKIKIQIGDYPGQAMSHIRRGSILSKLGYLAEAQTDFATARDLFRQLGQHHYAEMAEQNYQQVTQALQTPPPIPTEKPRSPWWVRLWRAWRRWLRRLFDSP